MKKAFGVLELLIVVVIAILLFFMCFKSDKGRLNPFEDNAKINTQKEMINDKIYEIEKTKDLRKQIEKNLGEGL